MKKMVKVILAAAAVVALAVPAMAADKLIVKNATGNADVFKVSDTGMVSLPVSGFVGSNVTFKNVAAGDAFASMAATPEPSVPDSAVALQVIPRGGGLCFPNDPLPGQTCYIRSQISVFNTDLNADPNNYEAIVLKAAVTSYAITSLAGGVGTQNRPINFEMGFDNPVLTIAANSNVGIGTVTPTSKLQVVGLPTYASNAAAITGGLTAGAFYRTATGAVMVVY